MEKYQPPFTITNENLGEEPTYQVIDNRVSVGLEKTRNVK